MIIGLLCGVIVGAVGILGLAAVAHRSSESSISAPLRAVYTTTETVVRPRVMPEILQAINLIDDNTDATINLRQAIRNLDLTFMKDIKLELIDSTRSFADVLDILQKHQYNLNVLMTDVIFNMIIESKSKIAYCRIKSNSNATGEGLFKVSTDNPAITDSNAMMVIGSRNNPTFTFALQSISDTFDFDAIVHKIQSFMSRLAALDLLSNIKMKLLTSNRSIVEKNPGIVSSILGVIIASMIDRFNKDNGNEITKYAQKCFNKMATVFKLNAQQKAGILNILNVEYDVLIR